MYAARLQLPLCLEGIRKAGKPRLHYYSKYNFQKCRSANSESGKNCMSPSIPCYSNQEHSQIRPLRHLPCRALLLGNPVLLVLSLQDHHCSAELKTTNGKAEQSQSCFTGRWQRRTEQMSPFTTPFGCNALRNLDSGWAADVPGHWCSCCQFPLVTGGITTATIKSNWQPFQPDYFSRIKKIQQ